MTPLVASLTGTSYVNTGLAANTKYFYKLAAINASGISAQSNEASATTAPGAPTGLSAAAGAAGTKKITISWTASPGATGYTIYRSTSSAGTYTQLTTATTTSYINTGLTAGTTYYYKVAATNASGTSTQVGPASAKAQ